MFNFRTKFLAAFTKPLLCAGRIISTKFNLKLNIMYKELEKFATGKKIEGIGVLPDKQEIKIYYDEYVANLGDLMEDFIKHQSKSEWRRNYYHDHLTKIYMDMLNKIEIRHGL